MERASPVQSDDGASAHPAARRTTPRFVSAVDAAIAERMARRPVGAFLYEFVRFGVKQGWACLFGGAMVALLLGSHVWYPRDAALARYDFLFLAALAIQALLLALRLETFEEAKVILAYHLVGTAMEIFKTSVGSWVYPEPAIFRIAAVPLFSGFMYSCIGSYLCRIWDLLHFEFRNHPSVTSLAALSVSIYVNFFAHHYVADMRWVLFAAAGLLFARTHVEFLVWRKRRSMPLLLGLLLVTSFIWIAENVGTFTKTWAYPGQANGWTMVSAGKFGSWFLLLIVSYTLVALIKRPKAAAART